MSKCVKGLNDYDLVEKCRFCKNISVKSNFFKNNTKKMVIDLIVYLVVRSFIIILEINY